MIDPSFSWSVTTKKMRITKDGNVNTTRVTMHPEHGVVVQTPPVIAELWSSPLGCYVFSGYFDLHHRPSIHRKFQRWVEAMELSAMEHCSLPRSKLRHFIDPFTGEFSLNAFSPNVFCRDDTFTLGTPYRCSFLLELQKVWSSTTGSWGIQFKCLDVLLQPTEKKVGQGCDAFLKEKEHVVDDSHHCPITEWFSESSL